MSPTTCQEGQSTLDVSRADEIRKDKSLTTRRRMRVLWIPQLIMPRHGSQHRPNFVRPSSRLPCIPGARPRRLLQAKAGMRPEGESRSCFFDELGGRSVVRERRNTGEKSTHVRNMERNICYSMMLVDYPEIDMQRLLEGNYFHSRRCLLLEADNQDRSFSTHRYKSELKRGSAYPHSPYYYL